MSGPDPDDRARRLGDFLATELGRPGIAVEELTRLSGGASRETFSAAVTEPDGTRRTVIVQRARPGAMTTRFSMVEEAALLRVAAAGGVPVAPVVAATDDPDVFGSATIVVGRLEGETIARRILRDDQFAPARSVLVEQAAGALAAIHALPTDQVPFLGPQSPLDELRILTDHLGQPHPAFELAFRWLDQHRPEARTDVVVHGDFRLGNLIVGPDGLRAVLDWELAHLGDPIEDLGWLCVKAWRFGQDLPVAGLGAVSDLVRCYTDAGGAGVDASILHWWIVLGTLRWGVICILQAETHRSGLSRSVELAAIGRRVCETEYDLMELLA